MNSIGFSKREGNERRLVLEVPFEQLGAGQKGRLAFQVIGRDGPIYNPKNIRYMSPGPGVAKGGQAGLGTALAGFNLLATAGVLVVSHQVLQDVRRLSEQLHVIDAKIDTVTEKLDHLLSQTKKINIKVSENNLRHGLQHVLQSSLDPTGIDIPQLAMAGKDIRNFLDALPDFSPVGCWGLSFSSDVSHQLELIFRLLFHLRCLITTRHNQAVAGDPRRVIPCDLMDDYLKDMGAPDMVKSIGDAVDVFANGKVVLRQDIESRFTFANETDLEEIESLVDRELLDPPFSAIDQTACRIFSDRVAGQNVRENELGDIVNEYRRLWLWHTDAGLLWRTDCELDFVHGGYEYMFCSGEEKSPLSEERELTVVCDLQRSLDRD